MRNIFISLVLLWVPLCLSANELSTNYYAKFPGKVVQGASRLDDNHWLITQDPDEHLGDEDISFSIIKNDGTLAESFSRISGKNINELSCPDYAESCGSHGQSIYVKHEADQHRYRVFIESASHDSLIEFLLRYSVSPPTRQIQFESMTFQRRIALRLDRYGKDKKFHSFGVHPESGKLALSRWSGARFIIEIFNLPDLSESGNALILGQPLVQFYMSPGQAIRGRMQGIALSGDSVYILVGNANINEAKTIYRYSSTDGKLVFAYSITDGLEDARNHSLESTASGDRAALSCDSGVSTCTFRYYEPEAIHFTQGRVHFSIVTLQPGPKISKVKPKALYSIREDDLKPVAATFQFGCQVTGSNLGCESSFACPSGTRVVSIKSACNLETLKLSSNALKAVPENTLAVIRSSDVRENGVCRINSLRGSSGNISLLSILDQSSFSFSCQEHDRNGGDCRVKGIVQCM